jgi:hypothetical protein
MPSLGELIQSIRARRRLPRARLPRARLPWSDLEADAARQGCSPPDIFFDWAGRPVVDSHLDRDHDGSMSPTSSAPARRTAT